jgi:hypothetical protein
MKLKSSVSSLKADAAHSNAAIASDLPDLAVGIGTKLLTSSSVITDYEDPDSVPQEVPGSNLDDNRCEGSEQAKTPTKRIRALVKDIANEFRIIPLMNEVLRQEYEQVLIVNFCEGYDEGSPRTYCHFINVTEKEKENENENEKDSEELSDIENQK